MREFWFDARALEAPQGERVAFVVVGGIEAETLAAFEGELLRLRTFQIASKKESADVGDAHRFDVEHSKLVGDALHEERQAHGDHRCVERRMPASEVRRQWLLEHDHGRLEFHERLDKPRDRLRGDLAVRRAGLAEADDARLRLLAGVANCPAAGGGKIEREDHVNLILTT